MGGERKHPFSVDPDTKMSTGTIQKPQWKIDQVLQGLIGTDVRVAAESFSPVSRNREAKHTIAASNLILPDNNRAAGLPIYLEGRLQEFQRRIGPVYVRLGPPISRTITPDGIIMFRGMKAVILKGPANVKLAYPHFIERIPEDSENYWIDLRERCAQLTFPFKS